MKKSNNSTPTGKSPNESTPVPKVPLRERGLKIGQELVDNLNRNVSQEQVPMPSNQPHNFAREEMLASLRKIYPGLSDEELIKACGGLI
jgi:hypothetical protein